MKALASVSVGVLMILAVMGCRPTASSANDPPAPPQAAKAPPTTDEYWANALQEIYRSPLELQAQHATERSRNIRLNKIMHGDPAKRQIALTFDDGPHPDCTPGLLKALADANAKATFFVVGQKAEAAPDLIKAEVAAGHNVGNHTYHHVNLTKIPNRLVAVEIQACGDVVERITGARPHLFRPPGGDYSPAVAQTANALGYTLVLWTDDPADYARPPANVLMTRTLDWAHNGGIVLIHDGVPETVRLLPQLLRDLKARGFEFVTIDEMLQQPGHA